MTDEQMRVVFDVADNGRLSFRLCLVKKKVIFNLLFILLTKHISEKKYFFSRSQTKQNVCDPRTRVGPEAKGSS